MATRWTSRVNPLSWVTRRRSRPAPVAPGGVSEYSTPSEYVKTTQDDYSAADRPSMDITPEWFGNANNQPQEFDQIIPKTATMNSKRPRTLVAEYDDNSQTLRVTYREGAVYDYPGVTPAQWADLQSERLSTGKWLSRNGLAGPGSGIRV